MMGEYMEYVILVDEQDRQIGTAEKMAAHKHGMLHRAFSIMLYRYNIENKLEMLLQRRSLTKYHTPHMWANSCCSHPRENETVFNAANRKLYQELNISAELQPISAFTYKVEFANGLIEHEYDHVLVGHYTEEVNNFNPEEVAETKWVEPHILEQDLVLNTDQYVPWLAKVVSTTLDNQDRFYKCKIF
jgi:isopentenyl-diphosphate Delta-isomerase